MDRWRARVQTKLTVQSNRDSPSLWFDFTHTGYFTFLLLIIFDLFLGLFLLVNFIILVNKTRTNVDFFFSMSCFEPLNVTAVHHICVFFILSCHVTVLILVPHVFGFISLVFEHWTVRMWRSRFILIVPSSGHKCLNTWFEPSDRDFASRHLKCISASAEPLSPFLQNRIILTGN